MMAGSEKVRVGRYTVALSSTGKVLFPGDGITKGDLVAHYERVAGLMLPLLRDRPDPRGQREEPLGRHGPQAIRPGPAATDPAAARGRGRRQKGQMT
jgi:bifunctional non-homologous end joining protein LigD